MTDNEHWFQPNEEMKKNIDAIAEKFLEIPESRRNAIVARLLRCAGMDDEKAQEDEEQAP